MSLQWQSVELNLGVSQDESAASFALPPQLLQSLKNARVYKTGGVGKRPGWTRQAVANGGPRVIGVDGQVFVLTAHAVGDPPGAAINFGSLNAEAQRVDSHSGASGSFSLSEVEVLERKTLARDILSGDGTGSLASSVPDFAVSANTGIFVVAWETAIPTSPGGPAQHAIMAQPFDVETRQPIAPRRRISTGTGDSSLPYVVLADPTTIVVVYSRPVVGDIRAVAYNCTARTWGTDTVVVTDLNTSSPHYDACDVAGGSAWYLAYRNTTPVVAVLKMTGVAVSVGPVALGEDSSTGSIAAWADTTNLWLAWYDATHGVRACIRSAAAPGTVVLGTTTMESPTDTALQMTWGVAQGSAMSLVWTTNGFTSEGATGYGRKLTKYRTLSTAGAKGTQIQLPDVTLISKACTAANGYTYAALLYDGSAVDSNVGGLRSFGNQVAFTIQITDANFASSGTFFTSFRAAATWAIGEAGRARIPSSLSSFRPVLVDATDNSIEYWFMLAPEFDVSVISSGAVINQTIGRPGVDLCRQRITPVPPIFAARIGGNVVFSGGVPQVWDGASLSEYGFFYPPENAKLSDGGTSGSPSLSAGSYGAQVVWEYRHATGDIARSIPTVARVDSGTTSLALGAAGHSLTVTLPALNVTRKWNESSAAEGVISRMYRTEANGTIYYAEGDYYSGSGFAASFPLAALLTLSATQADANAIGHAVIYTTGDILPNFPPPALSFIWTHRNRLFGIVAENRKQVVFTHEYEAGELPGWHPDLVIDVPDEAVALATIDEKLVILCKNGIYLIAGDGPDRKGLNSDYQQPFRLNSPHGCLTAGSVVSVPNGVMYLAPTGFCLMDRNTTVTRVGGPVEDTVSLYPYAHASVAIEDREWVYWALTNKKHLADSTDGRTICYDWRHNVWSVDQVLVPGELAPTQSWHTSFAASGSTLFGTVSTDSNVLKHEGSADPGSQWIFTYVKTAMLNLGSNSRYQRARWLTLLGEKRGIHQLAFTVTTFHHATSVPLQQFFTWTDSILSPMQNYALKMHLANQVGAFVQVEIADGPDASFPTLADDSARWVTLVLDVGLKRGTHQVAQAGME